MNYNTVYVGMDVHKESFTLCACTIDAERKVLHFREFADYKNVLKWFVPSTETMLTSYAVMRLVASEFN